MKFQQQTMQVLLLGGVEAAEKLPLNGAGSISCVCECAMPFVGEQNSIGAAVERVNGAAGISERFEMIENLRH